MNFSGPESQYPVAPPVVLAQVQVALLRPASELCDQCRFATAGRSGDDNLPKALPLGKGDALDHDQIFNFDCFQLRERL